MKGILGSCSNPSCIALRRRIVKKAGQATRKFRLIEEGDRVLVGFSGGKDSFTLLEYLLHFQKTSPIKFFFYAVMIDMNFPAGELKQIEKKLEAHQVAFKILPSKIPSIVAGKMNDHKNACVLCSRLRRGLLYAYARENGFNKVALGHNADDVIETFLLNLFYNGKIKAMSPNFLNDDGDLRVIRPLYYVFEREITEFSREMNFPMVLNTCPLLKYRGKYREKIKKLLDDLEEDFPAVRNNLIKSLGKIELRYLPFLR